MTIELSLLNQAMELYPEPQHPLYRFFADLGVLITVDKANNLVKFEHTGGDGMVMTEGGLELFIVELQKIQNKLL